MNTVLARLDNMPANRRYAIVTITRGALALGRKLRSFLVQSDLYVSQRFEIEADNNEIHINGPFDKLAENLFQNYDSLIWIMASGIVVRSIAKLMTHKSSDPAVLVIDEGAQFVISLLSGHLGRANEDARMIASLIHATPVITTASDVTHRLAVDSLAIGLGCVIDDLSAAKSVTAEIVNGDPVALISASPLPVNLPKNIHQIDINSVDKEAYRAVIIISEFCPETYHSCQVWLIPRRVVAGIGCRRGKSASEILEALDLALAESGIDIRALRNLVTIDLKADEPGLIAAARELNLPLHIIDREAINRSSIDFPRSDFVEKTVGVGGVCEPAALLDSKGSLLLSKRKRQGVTVALASSPWPNKKTEWI